MAILQESEKQRRREIIIEAAVKVFARKGFYNAKVKDVAREAGVADGTIYLYFKNKDDLLISLFESKMEIILTRFKNALKKVSDPLEKLTTFIKVYFDLIKEDNELSEVFQVELRQSTKFLKDYHNQKFADYLNIISSILDAGKRDSFFRHDLNTKITTLIIFGAIDEVARQWILGAGSKYSLKEAAEQTCNNLVSGLLVT